jgi:hypothetical protein
VMGLKEKEKEKEKVVLHKDGGASDVESWDI